MALSDSLYECDSNKQSMPNTLKSEIDKVGQLTQIQGEIIKAKNIHMTNKEPGGNLYPEKQQESVAKSAVGNFRLILEGKAQRNFLSKPGGLITDFRSVLEELDSCSSIAELKIVASANGLEFTEEDLNFVNLFKRKE